MEKVNGHVPFINVAGFFGSGSSAVVDLLKEFKDFYECDAEIRFIKDPGGICELESALIDHWELINSAAAIADFKKMVKIGCRRGARNPLSRAGLNYSLRINPKFKDITEKYLNKLTKYKYIGEFYHFRFQKNYFKFNIDRIRMAIEYYSHGKYKTANRNVELLHFSKPTREEFYEATKEYMEALFAPHINGKKNPHIILDQAISPNNLDAFEKYFYNSKLIIVDRDPRDTFVNECRTACYLDKDRHTSNGGHKYAIRQRALRANLNHNPNIMYVRFEDLILNYDETKSKIAEFVGVSLSDHMTPQKYLKPEVSSKNIGLWEKYYDEYREALDVIGEELSDLCYNK